METIISFIVVFAVLVLFHELGHFIVAKLVGIKVHEFSIGFGPRIGHRRIGETVYSLRGVPLGGYVRLAGLDRSEDDNEVYTDPRSYYSKPTWAKLATFVAGPFMNIVLAVLLYFTIFSVVGVPAVSVMGVLPESPADLAGLQENDIVVSVNGRRVEMALELFEIINANPGKELQLVVSREGAEVQVTAVPETVPGTGEGRLGIEIGEAKVKRGLLQTLSASVAYTMEIFRMITVFLWRVLTGRAAAEFTGPVGIFRAIRQTAEATPTFSAFVMGIMVLAAYLSTNLALFNLLPIPVLDGGWLVLIIVEAIRGKPVSVEHEAIYRFVGFLMIMALFVLVTLKDVF